MLLSRCGDCQHREICKHKEDYERVVRDITVAVPEPFTLVLNCKHYYTTHTYLNSQYESYASCNAAANVSNMEPLMPAGSETFVY